MTEQREHATRVRSIAILGRRWFEKTNGNTYFSCDIFVNGEQVHRIDFSYGYGSMYFLEGALWLKQNGYLPTQRDVEGLRRYCQRRKIDLYDSVADVQRKRDL